MEGLDVFIYDSVRTPRGRGDTKGALHSISPMDLLKPLYCAILERNTLQSDFIEDVILGCVTQVGDQGTNIARISALYGGLSHSISGVTLNRFCASGLDACQYASMKIASGSESLVLAGGVESSSRVPMFSDNGAWFKDPRVAKASRFIHMGVAADLVATQNSITRDEIDTYALRSQQRAAKATAAGDFFKSVVPIISDTEEIVLEQDELIRPQTTLEKLGTLPPAFSEIGAAGADRLALKYHPALAAINHIHHLGTSPALADGASLLLIGNEAAGKQLELKPKARVLACSNVATEPVEMLTGNIPGTLKALKSSGLEIGDIDSFEVNESFAAIPIQYQRRFELPDEKLNPCGGAIAMGHALGATGAMLLEILMETLAQKTRRYGLVSICGGAGVASTMIVENLRR
ncbi:MAG: acetyl-CoA C-acyltransferase [Myxococcota bacterium]|nr:acetyl-CoA C-acyltransferase [Myxococcota bacterium]